MSQRGMTQARLERIAALGRYIAEYPGLTRQELARQFALSERHLSEDLTLLREEAVRLTVSGQARLVRRQGYRYHLDIDSVDMQVPHD